MAKKKKVAIKHEELGLTGEVLEESLPVWISGGWTAVDDGDSDDEELALFFDDNDDPADPDADKE